MKSKNNGNVLFLILIAVTLFAALSYAVTTSSRSGGNSSRETNLLTVAEILNYLTSIENEILRLKITNGCSDNQISFETTHMDGWDYSHTPAARDDCHVFAPKGSVPYQMPDDWFDEATHVAGWEFYGNGNEAFTGHGTAKAELSVALLNIKRSVCERLNEKYAKPDMNSLMNHTAGTNVGNSADEFNGEYADTPNQWTMINSNDSEYLNMFCHSCTGNTCNLVKILIVR